MLEETSVLARIKDLRSRLEADLAICDELELISVGIDINEAIEKLKALEISLQG